MSHIVAEAEQGKMELTEGGCSRGSTQRAPGLRLNAIQPVRNHIGVAPCTILPTSTKAMGTEVAKEVRR